MIKIGDGGIAEMWKSSKDPELIALSFALQKAVQRVINKVEGTKCFSDIDKLEEKILDYIAVEQRAMYYSQKLPIEKKREILKNNMKWYTKAGTVSATKELVSIVFGEGIIKEWFEFEDKDALPGEFDIFIKTQINEEMFKQFSDVIEKVKNARSHLRHVSISYEEKTMLYIGHAVKETKTIKPANVIVVNPLNSVYWYINEKAETLTDEWGSALEA